MRFWIFSFSFCICFLCNSQKNYSLIIDTLNNNERELKSLTRFKDSASILQYLKKYQSNAIKKGFLLASFDSLKWESKKLYATYYQGQHFNKVLLTVDQKDLRFLDKTRTLKEKQRCSIPFSPHEITKLLHNIHLQALSNGYPFSSVYLKKIAYTSDGLTAQLCIETGNFYKISAIHIKGDTTLSEGLISGLIGIKVGDTYNERDIQYIPQKLSAMPFIRILKSHELLFTEKGVEVFLYLESSPLSSVNGVLGIQPNLTTKKYAVVGDFSLKLINVFKRGESLNINWKSIQPQTQWLVGRIHYPFLFKSPFGLVGQLELYKRDSSFLDLKSSLGITYALKGGTSLKLYYQKHRSDMLSGAVSNPNFTSLSFVNTNFYGLSFSKLTVDYIPNPSQGFILQLDGSVGNRKTRNNDTASVIQTTTFKASVKLDCFIPIRKRNILRIANTSEIYVAPEIFQNEVFRFGGLNSFRGFNEESLYATSKSIFTIEYRYLLDKNSAIFVFLDQGFYENRSIQYTHDHPLGLGVGISFGTKVGYFSMCYALGKQFDNPILIRDARIHFGYIAYF
jgi:outer membrane protein assembly factor BamA